jgi:hypothetical protein
VDEQPSEEEEPSRTEEPRRLTRIKRPNPKYVNTAITEEKDATEPETFKEAQLSLEWNKAMEEEFAALEQNQTWELVPKPRDVKPISCK